jgi:exopolyphosphatase/guanosine-5'-triphosphate,3'-diphosphate pyrophosphatase
VTFSGDSRPLSAALDLGTNTFLMTIGRAGEAGELHVLEDLCRTPRLGAGLATSGALSPAAVDRGFAVLAEFAERLRELGVERDRVRAVGTAALRRAANAREFVAAARERTGIAIEVIGGDEEARLGFAAVAAESASDDLAIVDVGGGSTEVVCERGRSRKSMPLGAVILTERFLGERGEGAWPDAQWSSMLREIEFGCRELDERFGQRRDGRALEVVALGGTAANLACLVLSLSRFDVGAAEGRRLATRDARRWAETLRALDVTERLRFGIERERAAILPAGLACLAGALERGAAEEFRATGHGLRYGVLRELVGNPARLRS